MLKNSNKPAKEKTFNKKKAIVISSAIAAFLLVLAGVIYIFRASILMAIAPKEYAAYCLSQTASQLKDDTTDLIDTLLGFELDSDTDFTFKNSLDMDGAKVPYESIEVAYVPSQKSASAQLKGVEIYEQKVDAGVIWNDRIIGVGVEELSETQYYAVSSKKFGKQLTNTKLPISKDIKENENLASLDLSFSNVTGKDDSEEEFEELKEALTDETLRFLKKGVVEDRSSQKKTINNTQRNAHSLNLSFEGKNIKEYLLNCISIANADKEFKNRFGNNFLKKTQESISKGEYNFRANIHLVLYDDRLVELKYDRNDSKMSFGFTFDSIECLLDGFSLYSDNDETHFSMETKGNLKPAGGKSDYEISISSNDKHTYIDMNLDFNANKVKITIQFPSMDKIEFSGKCKMGDGFELDVKGKESAIVLSVERGGSIVEPSGEEYMILEKSTPGLIWNFGKIIFKSEEARGIIVGFAKEAFGDATIIESLLNSSGGLGSFFGI